MEPRMVVEASEGPATMLIVDGGFPRWDDRSSPFRCWSKFIFLILLVHEMSARGKHFGPHIF